jgi:SNF2 family DNA or RNA helicase
MPPLRRLRDERVASVFRDINLFVEGRIQEYAANRQEDTAREILRRLGNQPGLVLADEVGMGKTFVALAVATSVALSDSQRRPVVVMVPPSLKEK